MNIRIKNIKVEGLFGMFTHEIPLNLENKLTIIYGENGIGKTMIFRILKAFLSRNFKELYELPFEKAEIEFEGAEAVSFWKTAEDKICFSIDGQGIQQIVDLKYTDSKDESELFENLIRIPGQHRHRLLTRLKKHLGSLDTSFNLYQNLKNADEWSPLQINRFFHDEIRAYIRAMPEFFSEYIGRPINNPEIDCPNEILEIIGNLKVFFIATQRLYQERFDIDRDLSSRKNGRVRTVVNNSKNLINLIKENHSNYQKETDSLESSLRSRLTSKEVKTDYSDQDLKSISEEVAQKKKELLEVGLLDDNDTDNPPLGTSLSEVEKAILGVNLIDMKKKLSVFDDTQTKLQLLLEIVNNRRFSYKKLSISPTKGFVFKNDMGEELKLKDLSSGEQHELVLLYDLIFKVPQNSLIMLDEPEISLHIAWQKEFLHDMQEIIKLRGFDLLIATHSPSIINGNWDYTVSLKGSNN